MIRKSVTIQNETGLHARPASELVKIANKYKSDIQMIVGDKTVNVKSMLGVMSAGVKVNTQIEIECNGEDEEEAMAELLNAFENKFGE